MPSLRQTRSGGYASRARIPDDVRDAYKARYGQRLEAKFSAPATVGREEAKRLFGEWQSEHAARVAALRAERTGEGVSLTFRQAGELAADWYRWFVPKHEAAPQARDWEQDLEAVQDALIQGDPETHKRLGSSEGWPVDTIDHALPVIADQAETQTFLHLRGVTLNPEGRERFLRALFPHHAVALKRLAALSEGAALTEDTHAATLPRRKPRDSGETPWQLFEAWVSARQPSAGTVESWRYMFRNLEGHFEGRSAGSITEDEARAWITGRITPKRSARTVANTWTRAVNTVFGWALEQRRIPQNPFAGIKITRQRAQRVRESKAFTAEEASAILRASLAITDTTRPDEAAKRWVPWLCAYTGARPGEITQLRGADIAVREGVLSLHLTPEAGTIKGGSARMVPVHAHLVEQGFPEWAKGRGPGPLFYRARKGGETPDPINVKKPPGAQVRQRLATWVRELGVSDPNVSPGHGWRHTFKMIGRRAGLSDSILDEICGHAPPTVGRDYGRATLADKADAIARFPRFEITTDSTACSPSTSDKESPTL